MKCGVWRVQCEVWGVKSAVWSVECEVWSVECEVWSVECEVWSVECEVWSVDCEVWSLQWEACSGKRAVWRVQCEVCSMECEDCQVWSVKWSFKCDMWNKTPVSQSARTHGLGWRTAHASSIDEKGLIYIFKATSAPPRAGTTGILIYIYGVYIYMYMIDMCIYIYRWDKPLKGLAKGLWTIYYWGFHQALRKLTRVHLWGVDWISMICILW